MVSRRRWEEINREVARRVLWGDREVLLPHVIEHKCPVGEAVEQMCKDADWDYLSYLTAAVFDEYDLIEKARDL